jgi:hypothetical protein
MTIATGNISERDRTNNLFHVTICRRKAGEDWWGESPIVFLIVIVVVIRPRLASCSIAFLARQNEDEHDHEGDEAIRKASIEKRTIE